MKHNEAESFNQKNVFTGRSQKGYGLTYFAKKDFKVDEKIMMGYGRITDHQTSHCSVQIGLNKHYVPTKWTGKYWNHSCNPNTYIKTGPDGFPYLYARKRIKEGEEIYYAYWMTEYEWSPKAKENWVACKCGTKKGRHTIPSFSSLPVKVQKTLKSKGFLSKYLISV